MGGSEGSFHPETNLLRGEGGAGGYLRLPPRHVRKGEDGLVSPGDKPAALGGWSWVGFLRLPPRHGGKGEGRKGSSEIAFDSV